MPVTKTAKRALRSSQRKEKVNKVLMTRLDVAIRLAKSQKNAKNVQEASSLADKALKKKIIKKNKAARIKSALSKLLPKSSARPSTKKASTKRK